MELTKHPIMNIHWFDTSELDPNHYNPNVVQNSELNLLKRSLLEQGWIQPLLVTASKIIIDGFHRYWLTVNDNEVRAFTKGQVPCAILDISEREAMIITIRMNRAKGNHMAFKMHDIITELVKGGMSKGKTWAKPLELIRMRSNYYSKKTYSKN